VGGADGSRHLYAGGYDVGRRASSDLPEDHGHGTAGIDGAVEDGGKVGDEAPGGIDQVDAAVRTGGMAAGAFEDDREAVGRTGYGPGAQAEVAGEERRVDMEGDDGRHAPGHPLTHHRQGSARKRLLARLEHESDPTRQLEPGQDQGDPGGDGGVGVVATGVHDPGYLGGVGVVGRLG